jgi:GT2 family glycosyltransferase
MSDQAPIYIVIADFDGWQQTKECLRSLERSTYRNYRVIVVDHGLTDETARGLDEFSSCTRIPAESSLWWAGATNVGIRSALEEGAQYIMLLNNDCYVTETTIEQLIEKFDTTTEKIIAPLQISAHSGEELAGNVTTCFTLGFPTLVLPWASDLRGRSDSLISTQLIVGGRGVVIPCSVFNEVGLFDEANLPHYGADHDFYLRCRQAKIELAIAPDAIVSIDETKTTTSRNLRDMTFGQFIASFSDTRSHRNLAVLTTLFKRYYPIKSLYFVGVFLNVLRYTLSYAVARLTGQFAMMRSRENTE